MERIFRLDCEGDVTVAEGVGEIYQGRLGAPVGLCFAIPKGDKLDLVARQITELGVAELHLWSAERSIGVWKQQKVKQKLARLERVTREASRQSGRADELMIYLPARLQDLVIRHQHVPLRLFLDPKADHGWDRLDLSAQPLTADHTSVEQNSVERDLTLHDQTGLACVLIVGPEGGISPSEQAQLCEAGWRGVRLASPVLRTETAGVVACALALDRLGYLA
jgi:16S rRNA (uracil1498-N3)-methyltransferase